MSAEAIVYVVAGIALITLGYVVVAQCNAPYPAPVPGFPQDAAQHPLVIRRVIGGCAFVYSTDFELLVSFAFDIGMPHANAQVEPRSQAYSVYVPSAYAGIIRERYGV